jgi:hypothetical protein
MSNDPENRGPLMRLTADLDIGKQNLVANFAHQMGVSFPFLFLLFFLQLTVRLACVGASP